MSLKDNYAMMATGAGIIRAAVCCYGDSPAQVQTGVIAVKEEG